MVTDGVEIQDWVLEPAPDTTATYRRQNEATNVELQRRAAVGVDLSDPWLGGTIRPSGEGHIPGIPPEPGYLVPTLGFVSTPDPGVLPHECVFVAKVRGPMNQNARLAAQFPGAPNNAWTVMRLNGQIGYAYRASVDGSTNNPNLVDAFMPDATGADELIAFAINRNDGTSSVLQCFTSPNGSYWQPYAATTWAGPLPVPYDSPAPVTIGRDVSGTVRWDGRLYWVELRTGLDPAGGTVLWRFDGHEYPGAGMDYTDPRGRTWTLSDAGCITPTVPEIPAPQRAVDWVDVAIGSERWQLVVRDPFAVIPPA
jgi:hypothetical protein